MDLFISISLIIIIAALISILMRILRQPLIIGYIITGIIVSAKFSYDYSTQAALTTLSQFGVALLLFMVGLGLNPKIIKEVGTPSFLTGIFQVILTAILGYYIGIGLGFSNVESLFLGIAFTFSSTIIIMKLLSDKDSLDKLYGKISIGFLLVQDLIAIIILLVISALSSGENATNLIFSTLIKGGVLFAIL